MRIRQHNAPKSFSSGLTQTTHLSEPQLPHFWNRDSDACLSGLLCTLESTCVLPLEGGQASRRTRAAQPGRRWAQSTGPRPVPGPLRISIEATEAPIWPQLACWWIPCLPSSPPSVSGLQGPWLPHRLCSCWFLRLRCPPHPAPSERPERVSAGGGGAAWEELGWQSSGVREAVGGEQKSVLALGPPRGPPEVGLTCVPATR